MDDGLARRARELVEPLRVLRERALEAEARYAAPLARIPAEWRPSARNLAHYLAIRQVDIRPLQYRLHRLGLSSLGRMEAYVLATIDSVLRVLDRLGGDDALRELADPPVDFEQGRQRLSSNAAALLGPPAPGREVRIMVTAPSEAAERYGLVEQFVAAGMDVLRINCAQDGPEQWEAMIRMLRRAEQAVGRCCKVHFDLSGPNPRTGPLEGRPGKATAGKAAGQGRRGKKRLPPVRERTFRLAAGDRLLLTRADVLGRRAQYDRNGELTAPASVGCTLHEALRDVRAGDRLFYDDGALEAVVRSTSADGLEAEVVHARKGAVRMRGGKSLNFPDTDFDLPALTEKDLADLDFAAAHGDSVGLSFVRQAGDVTALADELERRRAGKVGIVLKIETRSAFQRLPSLLFAAMQRPPVGVMVARGDMAAELGFQRMSEAQEEVLWLCEAAHVPVIWATQVLETMAKKGVPTRGEVTDAAMAGRAECVMLNKGPYMAETMRFLVDVLGRMRAHQTKKFATLRSLSISQDEGR
jgi:pyruvate kinase